jgi:hypothetical protein
MASPIQEMCKHFAYVAQESFKCVLRMGHDWSISPILAIVFDACAIWHKRRTGPTQVAIFL